MFSSGHSDSIDFIDISYTIRDRIRKFFQQYSSDYRKENDPVYNRHMELKQIHIEKVCDEIKKLGSFLGMKNNELAFAEVMALLHDIGRFEQFDRYRTFSDAESENHAEIALRIIEKEDLLHGIDELAGRIILQSILSHNLPVVPEHKHPLINFYSRLLRDADKLDIWRITLENNIFHKINTDFLSGIYDVPDILLSCFEQQRIITLDMVNSFYDSVLFRMSWIFDLNFLYTLQIAHERGIFDKLSAKLPGSEKLMKITLIIHQYLLSNI